MLHNDNNNLQNNKDLQINIKKQKIQKFTTKKHEK